MASTNQGVLNSLASFYGLPQPEQREPAGEVFRLSEWIDSQLGRA